MAKNIKDGSDMFVWWGSGSAPCWRLLITLQEKGLTKYGEKIITFSKKEHKAEDIMAINPRGQVPTFKHGDLAVNESLASCLYVASHTSFKGQGTELLPDEQLGLVLQRYHEAAINFQSKLVDSLIHWARNNQDNEEEKKERQKKLKEEILIWEKYLSQTGDYIAGANFTLADTTFFSFLAFCVRIGLELDSLPKLKAYYERVKARPSVTATWPPHWKDSAGPEWLKGIMSL